MENGGGARQQEKMAMTSTEKSKKITGNPNKNMENGGSARQQENDISSMRKKTILSSERHCIERLYAFCFVITF